MNVSSVTRGRKKPHAKRDQVIRSVAYKGGSTTGGGGSGFEGGVQATKMDVNSDGKITTYVLHRVQFQNARLTLKKKGQNKPDCYTSTSADFSSQFSIKYLS